MKQQFPSLSEVSEAYDQRYSQEGLRESEGFYRWVLRHLAPGRGMALLDVSCGEGHLLHWASRVYGVDGWGIDLSAVALQVSQRQASQARLARCDATTLPFASSTFDCVTNLGSLEHYPDIPQGVREMVRVLRPGGKAAIQLPNSYYLGDIIWDVVRTGYGPNHQQPLEKFATAGEWEEILEEGGLRTERVLAYNYRYPRSAADWQWYRARPQRFLRLLLAPIVPFNLSYCFLFICEKPSTDQRQRS